MREDVQRAMRWGLRILQQRLRGAAWLRRLQAGAGGRAGAGAGSGASAAALAGWSAALALAGAAASLWCDAPPLLTVAVAAVMLAAPCGNLVRLRASRMGAMEAQMPDVLDTMARTMQAGHSFASALRAAGQDGPAPVAQEFRATFDEINFGLSEEAALTNLAARVPLPDMRYFVMAVLIARQAGGNLAQLMLHLSALVRERIALRGSVRVMSAEGRLSAWILGILPFVIAALVGLMNPAFLRVLWTDPAGLNLVWLALGGIGLGVLWMRRIIRIRV